MLLDLREDSQSIYLLLVKEQKRTKGLACQLEKVTVGCGKYKHPQPLRSTCDTVGLGPKKLGAESQIEQLTTKVKSSLSSK